MKFILKQLWPQLYVYRWRIFGIFLLGAGISGLKSLTPELLTRLMESWKTNDSEMALFWPIILGVAWIASNIFTYFHLFWMKFIGERIAVKFRQNLMDKYLSLNLGFLQDFQRGSGGLISRMLNDIYVIQDGINNLAAVLREPFMIIGILCYVLYKDWQLTLMVVGALPLIALAMKQIAKSLRKYGHLNQESMEDLTKTLKESLDGSRIVQSFNLEEEMQRRFYEQANTFLSYRKKILSREEFSSPFSEALTVLVMVPMLIYIGSRIAGKQLTAEEFTGFFLGLGLLADSVKKLQTAYIKLQQCSVALERMDTLLNTHQPVTNAADPKPFPKDWTEITYKNVHFSYSDTSVLKGVNLTVKKGEVIALVGMSGGGKSTMVNLLERFIDTTSGEICIGETPIKSIDLKELRAHIALVSQDVFLFNDTIASNIHMGNLSRDINSVKHAAEMANAMDFINNCPQQFDTKVGDLGGRLSGGEKQRISIARAIFKDAPILILDEATSALDTSSEVEVQRGLERLMEGRTAFVIAHRLSTITKADRIIVLKDGLIAEQGTHADLLQLKGEYFNYYKMQS